MKNGDAPNDTLINTASLLGYTVTNDNGPSYLVSIDSAADIHHAYLGALATIDREGISHVSIGMNHRDDGPLTMRGGLEKRCSLQDESRRLDPGGTYYHFERSSRNRSYTTTGCYTEATTVSNSKGVSNNENRFIHRVRQGISDVMGYDVHDIENHGNDLYVDEQQVVGMSFRYFRRAPPHDDKPFMLLKRACWQTLGFGEACSDSELLRRDGVDPSQYKENVVPVSNEVLTELIETPSTYTTPTTLSQPYQDSVDNVITAVEQGDADRRSVLPGVLAPTNLIPSERRRQQPKTCIGGYDVSWE